MLTPEQWGLVVRYYPLAMSRGRVRRSTDEYDAALDGLIAAVVHYDPRRGRSLRSYVAARANWSIIRSRKRSYRQREIERRYAGTEETRDDLHVDHRDEVQSHLLRASPYQREAMLQVLSGEPRGNTSVAIGEYRTTRLRRPLPCHDASRTT